MLKIDTWMSMCPLDSPRHFPQGLLLGVAEGLLTQEERKMGIHLQVKQRHWLTILSHLDTCPRSRKAHPHSSPLAWQCTSFTLLVSRDLCLLKTKKERKVNKHRRCPVQDSRNSLKSEVSGVLVLSIGKSSHRGFQHSQLIIKHCSISQPPILRTVAEIKYAGK